MKTLITALGQHDHAGITVAAPPTAGQSIQGLPRQGGRMPGDRRPLARSTQIPVRKVGAPVAGTSRASQKTIAGASLAHF